MEDHQDGFEEHYRNLVTILQMLRDSAVDPAQIAALETARLKVDELRQYGIDYLNEIERSQGGKYGFLPDGSVLEDE